MDLASSEERHIALDAAKRLVPPGEFGAMSYDIEWRLGPDPDWSQVLALFLEDGGGYSGYAPLFRQARPLDLRLGEVKWASFHFERLTLNGPPVLRPGSADEQLAIAIALIDAVAPRMGRHDAIYFEGLPVESVMYQALRTPEVRRRFIGVPLGEPFEHLFARLPGTYEEYLRQLGSRSRQSVQYSERKLAKDMEGAVRADCFRTVASVERFLADGSDVSRRTYQWNLLGLGLRDSPGFRAQLKMAAEQGWFRSYILYCKDRPAAFMLGFEYANCYYYTDVGYDPEYTSWSVGTVLQLKVLQHLYESGAPPALFDFSTGYGSHKARFGNVSRLEANVLLLPRTLRNRAIVAAFRSSERFSVGAATLMDRLGLKSRIKKFLRRFAGGR